MILIDNTEILTVLDGMTFSGAKDIITRQLVFSFLCNPLKKEIPLYKVNVGSKVEWKEDNKTLFLGYVEELPYNTDEDTITLTCQDLMTRLVRSTFIGRMQGTLTELANNICGTFGIKNGIESDSTHVHNIVSTGDLTYYDVLKIACDTMFNKYTLYMQGDTLTLITDEQEPVNEFSIGVNIRGSQFRQSMSDMVTKVLVIDNEGKVLDAVENTEDLQKYGLFQATYNYSEDCKNNLAEASKLLKGVNNEGAILCNNDNACISGKFIKINEPVNGFNGIFEITSDNHTINTNNSEMTLEVEYVRAG
jgi:hypothetical protein